MVPLRMLEVDQLDVRVLLAGDFIDIDLSPVQQLQNGLVRFDEALGGLIENLVDQVVDLLVGEPGLVPARCG